MPVRNTILIRGDWVHEENGLAVDYNITPGMLVEPTVDSNGVSGFTPHATAAGAAAALFAQVQIRKTATGPTSGIDDEIPVGDGMSAIHARKGDVINAVTVETIIRGELVESAGDGTVGLGSGTPIGVAYKDSDLSGTVGRVEIIVI
jgi:hypothetical protein